MAVHPRETSIDRFYPQKISPSLKFGLSRALLRDAWDSGHDRQIVQKNSVGLPLSSTNKSRSISTATIFALSVSPSAILYLYPDLHVGSGSLRLLPPQRSNFSLPTIADEKKIKLPSANSLKIFPCGSI